MIKRIKDWAEDSVIPVVIAISLGVVLFVFAVEGAYAGGTALWRSDNTDPKVGAVWVGGTFSNTAKKCVDSNLVIENGNGIAVVKDAPECTKG